MSKAPKVVLDPTPHTTIREGLEASRRAAEANAKPDIEMLAGRVSGGSARRFRGIAKTAGITVQEQLQLAIDEYMERHRN